MPILGGSNGKSSKFGGLFGEDCERPACDDIKNSLPGSMEDLKEMAKNQAASKKVQCPPRKGELGRSSWKLLHSMVCRMIGSIPFECLA